MAKLFFDIITIFPDMFRGVLEESIVKRAVEKGLVEINVVNLRDFTFDRHATVDDNLYGGIPGMLMKCEPLALAIRGCKAKRNGLDPRVIYLSPKGKRLEHGAVVELATRRSLILICGRYKGIDQRIIDLFVDEEISIGDYVVSGGELPAMVLVDAVTRLLPGAIGDRESAESDSLYEGLLEPPNYTRPEIFEDRRAPEVLLSGHHENIRKWRLEQSLELTKQRRPDLYREWEKRGQAEPGK